MPGNVSVEPGPGTVPSWVPEAALRYLAHTEDGQSIRALARRCGCVALQRLRQHYEGLGEAGGMMG